VDGEEEGKRVDIRLLVHLDIMERTATMTKGFHLLDTMTEETIVDMTSMSGTTTTECRLGNTPPPPGTTPPPVGTMTDTMIQGIVTLTRGRDTMRTGMERGMDLRPGHIMTDPQLQGGTTMTPESMKGMKDIHCIKAAITAAVEGAEAPCHPQGGATEGVTRKMEGRQKSRKHVVSSRNPPEIRTCR